MRSGHLQYLRSLDVDAMETEVPALAGCGRYGSRDGEYRKDAVDAALKSDSIPDELGTRYPPS